MPEKSGADILSAVHAEQEIANVGVAQSAAKTSSVIQKGTDILAQQGVQVDGRPMVDPRISNNHKAPF